jgi:hypothetical protein
MGLCLSSSSSAGEDEADEDDIGFVEGTTVVDCQMSVFTMGGEHRELPANKQTTLKQFKRRCAQEFDLEGGSTVSLFSEGEEEPLSDATLLADCGTALFMLVEAFKGTGDKACSKCGTRFETYSLRFTHEASCVHKFDSTPLREWAKRGPRTAG